MRLATDLSLETLITRVRGEFSTRLRVTPRELRESVRSIYNIV